MAFDAFKKLTREKQRRVINAGLEVFAEHDYKHASTDDIAAKAGISKGLLFYYFKNKKEFYLYLMDYTLKIISDEIIDWKFHAITDFLSYWNTAPAARRRCWERSPIGSRLRYGHSTLPGRIYPSLWQTKRTKPQAALWRIILGMWT